MLYKKKLKFLFIIVLYLISIPAFASSPFYQGKVMNIIVPYGVGGHYDAFARLIGPYMANYLGLKSVHIINKTGGGGLIGTNAIYHAKADGLTIGDTNAAGDYFAQLLNDKGVHFDMRKFQWIGRPDNDPATLCVHSDSKYQNFKDLVKIKNYSGKVSVLATGKGSNEYNAAFISLNAFHIPLKMVAGFKGLHAVISTFISGEGDLMPAASSHAIKLKSKVKPILLLHNSSFNRLPHVPTIIHEAHQYGLSSETITTLEHLDDVMSLGHTFVAPPNVPAARIEALREAFKRTLHNPTFIKKATKEGLFLGYKSGQTITKKIEASFKDKKGFKKLLQQN